MSETLSLPPKLPEIRAAIEARLQELRPLVEECERLEKAEAALEAADRKLRGAAVPLTHADDPAPYGYKADGTPYKRRPPADPDYARRGWETRRQEAESAAAA